MPTPRRFPVEIPPLGDTNRWIAVEEALQALTLALLANTTALERWTRVVVTNTETQRQQARAAKKHQGAIDTKGGKKA